MPEKPKTIATIELLDAIHKLETKVDRLEDKQLTQHSENMSRLEAIEAQVKYTNGRVRGLELTRERNEAVEAYKNTQSAQQPMMGVKVETNNTWDWKVVLAILLTLATAVAAIAGVASR